MKQFAVIILMLIVFMQTFNRFVLQADYFINKSYIANNLCENKDKPAMNCCGKCFLKKQQKKQDKQDQSSNKKESSEVQLYFGNDNYLISGQEYLPRKQYFVTNHSRLTSFPRSVFHPPSV